MFRMRWVAHARIVVPDGRLDRSRMIAFFLRFGPTWSNHYLGFGFNLLALFHLAHRHRAILFDAFSFHQVFFLENQSDELITSLTMISPVELNAATRLLSPALDLLAQLDKMFECRIVISEEDGLVLYMCAGAYNGEWCGLMGISVESD